MSIESVIEANTQALQELSELIRALRAAAPQVATKQDAMLVAAVSPEDKIYGGAVGGGMLQNDRVPLIPVGLLSSAPESAKIAPPLAPIAVTRATVYAVLKEVLRLQGNKALRPLFAQFDVANFTEVPVEKYAELQVAASALLEGGAA